MSKVWGVIVTVMLLLTAVLGLGAIPSAKPQACRGSHIYYIVRGERGEPLNADKDLTFASELSWRVRRGSISGPLRPLGGIDEVSGLLEKTGILETGALCVFKAPVALDIARNGVVMKLTFVMKAMGDTDSIDFLVDSLPFQDGAFTIDLPADPEYWKNRDQGERMISLSRLYPAIGWKRLLTKQ